LASNLRISNRRPAGNALRPDGGVKLRRMSSMKLLGTMSIVVSLLTAATFADAVDVGEKAPPFSLKGTDGETHSLADFAGKKHVVVVFTCNHCPVAKAYEDRLIQITKDYAPKDVVFLAVNPNDATKYPEDSFDEMKKRAAAKSYPFAYLRDADSSVAKAYGAKVTPHVYVVDTKGVVRYVGRIDDNMDTGKVKQNDLREALDSLLAGEKIEVANTKAFGCSIKWVR
jgi:peroxiredoxin